MLIPKNRPHELAAATDRTLPIGQVIRPAAGWLRTGREALGLTLADVAKRLQVTPPAVRSFEKAEAEDRITLASLRRTADAMGFEVIYVLVPRTGTRLTRAETETHSRNAKPSASIPSSSAETPGPDAADKKVTDLTWHTLHGDP